MIDTSLKQPSITNLSKENPGENIEGKKRKRKRSKKLQESNVVLETSNTQPSTSTVQSTTQTLENKNKILLETTIPVIGSKKEPDTIKEKPIKEDQTSTVDIVTKIEPTAKEVKKCSSKDKILSDNSPIQESKDQSKKAKTSNTKISQSKKEDGVKVESIVTSSTSSNNLKEVMYKKKNNEQPLVNLTAPINNLEKDLKTLLEKTLANCDTKDKQSEKPLPKTKKLMKYSSRPWSDIVEEYEAMMMNSKFLM
ncbi:uncharacterized protein LOC112688892 isoform X2 [Sipha flava]|nr:uncharacterized protein LOC112688892 isoform X2 [Sipha flava]